MSGSCKIASRAVTQCFAEYQAELLPQGFDEVLERRWAPNTVVPAHVHGFTAKALMVQGEMWLTVGEDTHHLLAGNIFELDANVMHSERYGKDGAIYWVARRQTNE